MLYVEDDPRDGALTQRHFERHAPHLKLTVVETVSEALERLTVGDVDLVLSDYRLPDGTGRELLGAITSREVNVPVVLVTGSGDVEAAVQLLKAGAADYVVKRSTYLTTLPQIIEGAFRWFQSVREARRSPVRVLYAEHDPSDVELTRRAFAEEGPHLQLHVAARGQEALQMLKTLPYDVLLLDYRLPDLTGIELLKALREESIRIPVVMVTGQVDEETAVQAFKLGVGDYIVKRQDYLAKLPSTLENVLAQRRLSDEKDALLILDGLTKSIAMVQDVDAVVHRVARAAADLLRVEMSVLWVVDGLRLRPVGLAGVEESLGRALEGRVEPEFLERAASQRTVQLADLQIGRRDDADTVAILEGPGRLAVALVRGAHAVGVLGVMSRRPREFTAVEARLLMALADHAAIAIENATLYQRVKEQLKDLERTQTQLFQTEKVAAMGQLLAGVAHELNNPLAVVLGRTALIRERLHGGPLAAQAETIVQAAERCARIVKNFLALARQRPPERQHASLNRVVAEATDLLAYHLRTDSVELIMDLAEDLPALWADPHQLHQVVVNLIANAHHAMRATPPPRRLTITSRLDLSRDRILLEVADTGPGMGAEIRARLFEPFFTTKRPGQGTGLGLSLCQGIVEGHGGSISVESQPGRGARFTIALPLTSAPLIEPAARMAEAERPVRAGAILVVEDEPEIAGLLAEVLSEDGHHVETAPNGAVALERLRAGRYDLIISDLRMPELDGPGLYRELERSYPALLRRVIFLTGDTLGREITEFLETTGAPSLAKPFAVEEVRRITQRVLQP